MESLAGRSWCYWLDTTESVKQRLAFGRGFLNGHVLQKVLQFGWSSHTRWDPPGVESLVRRSCYYKTSVECQTRNRLLLVEVF